MILFCRAIYFAFLILLVLSCQRNKNDEFIILIVGNSMNPLEPRKAVELRSNRCYKASEIVDMENPSNSYYQYSESSISSKTFHRMCKLVANHWNDLKGDCLPAEDDTPFYIGLNYQQRNDSITTSLYCISIEQLELFETLLELE